MPPWQSISTVSSAVKLLGPRISITRTSSSHLVPVINISVMDRMAGRSLQRLLFSFFLKDPVGNRHGPLAADPYNADARNFPWLWQWPQWYPYESYSSPVPGHFSSIIVLYNSTKGLPQATPSDFLICFYSSGFLLRSGLGRLSLCSSLFKEITTWRNGSSPSLLVNTYLSFCKAEWMIRLS